MFSSLVHPRNLVTATTLIIGGLTYGVVAPKPSTAHGVVTDQSEPKVRRGHAPRIGPYRLSMNTGDASGLVELTAAEKKALNVTIEFKGERIYHAPSANFADTSWEIVLGSVDNVVYKVSALVVLDNREDRNKLWGNINNLLKATVGSPAGSQTNIVFWDTEDGNVVLNRPDEGSTNVVVLTLTSRAVSGFVRIK